MANGVLRLGGIPRTGSVDPSPVNSVRSGPDVGLSPSWSLRSLAVAVMVDVTSEQRCRCIDVTSTTRGSVAGRVAARRRSPGPHLSGALGEGIVTGLVAVQLVIG